jgi:hypothetical protein
MNMDIGPIGLVYWAIVAAVSVLVVVARRRVCAHFCIPVSDGESTLAKRPTLATTRLLEDGRLGTDACATLTVLLPVVRFHAPATACACSI